jgi:hypothetical protein
MPFHMKSVQMYWKVLNMEMNLWELAIHLNILNISKDCQRICSDFIFTATGTISTLVECICNKENKGFGISVAAARLTADRLQ